MVQTVGEIENGTSNSGEYENPTDPLGDLSRSYSLEYTDYYGNPLHNGDKRAYLFQFYNAGEFCKGSVFEVNFKESGDGTNGDTNEGAVWISLLWEM